jgi:glutamine cyclotransferase
VCTLTPLIAQNDFKIIQKFPHNTSSYTQGLFYLDGRLYEGTGKKKESKLLEIELSTGKVLKERKLSNDYFGEGIVKVNDQIIQLTWQQCTAFVYDFKTFDFKKSFTYQSEGWGITFNGTYLIVSDGTHKLAFYDPQSFTLIYSIEVMDWNGKVENLNELEFVDGIIYANIYQTNDIVSIDPISGDVIERYNFDSIVDEESKKNPKALQLNGIAYNPKTKNFYITGKYWSTLYEIKLTK